MKASNCARLRKIEEALLPPPAPSGPVCVVERPGKPSAERRRAEAEGRRIIVLKIIKTPKSISTPAAASIADPEDDVDRLREEVQRLEARHAELSAEGSDE